MSTKENTGLRDNLPSTFHRSLGARIYMTDLDALEFTYVNGATKAVAIVDHKNGNVKKLIKTAAIELQRNLADQLRIPFFVAITFLDLEMYPVPMYFVLPMNGIAQTGLKGKDGKWMSVYQFARLQHNIRSLKVNEQELCGLSRATATYDLPTINY